MVMKFKAVVLFALMSLFIMSSSAYAVLDMNEPIVYVNGFVYEIIDGDKILLSGVDVSVECMMEDSIHDGNTVDTTTVNGHYIVSLNCPMEGSVKVSALDGAEVIGFNTGGITKAGSIADVDIGISRVDVMVPEFSMIIIPFLMSLAGFAFVRGKSLI